MISVNGYVWKEIKVKQQLVQKIKQDFKFSTVLSNLIVGKNFNNEEIYSIKNDIDILNPFLNNQDFINAKNLIINFIKNKKKILVLGDYDVDGTVSTSVLINLFRYINHPYDYYIPDRSIDGYGVSIKLLKKLHKRLPELIIIVDSGSKSHEAINYLNNLNIKSIIIDHHDILKPYPKSNILINPKKELFKNDHVHLCASALVYFLVEIINKELNLKFLNKTNLLMTALATICDVMPLRGLNRNIILKAFKNYNYKESYFIDYLLTKIKKTNNLHYDDFGYLIGPTLNSGGRLNKSNLPIDVIISTDKIEIRKITDQLIDLNNKRKEIEKNIINKIDKKNIIEINDKIMIIKDISIPEGLIGIIASRFLEKLNKLVIVITQSGNVLKGSARSTPDINIGSIINNCVIKKILTNGGGHQMAAGFSLKKNKFDDFKDYLIKFKTSNLKIKKEYFCKISSSAININFIKDIKKLEPFGNGNDNPSFLVENLKIHKPRIINKSHIFCLLKDKKNKFFDSITFNSVNTTIGDYIFNYKNYINVICKFNLSGSKNNKINIQIVDILT